MERIDHQVLKELQTKAAGDVREALMRNRALASHPHDQLEIMLAATCSLIGCTMAQIGGTLGLRPHEAAEIFAAAAFGGADAVVARLDKKPVH